MSKKLRVFVYGTLKSEQANHRVLQDAEFIGRATIKGAYRLVDLGWYPAVVRMPSTEQDREIGGEVYEIDSDLLQTLDMIEGHPHYYRREKVHTSLDRRAWVYTLPPDYGQREAVPTTFWRQSEAEEAWVHENTRVA